MRRMGVLEPWIYARSRRSYQCWMKMIFILHHAVRLTQNSPPAGHPKQDVGLRQDILWIWSWCHLVRLVRTTVSSSWAMFFESCVEFMSGGRLKISPRMSKSGPRGPAKGLAITTLYPIYLNRGTDRRLQPTGYLTKEQYHSALVILIVQRAID